MKHEKLVCAMAVVWIIAIWCAEGGEAMRMMSNSWSNAHVNVRAHGYSNSNSEWRGRFGADKRRVPTGSNPLHNRSYMHKVHIDSERH
ncbi:hypothetical protein SUGI_0228210 [Cryptomeria japonica]|nr:hypothetical protein SUGI_0228210 [Cryptomeria japonica]